MKRDNRRDGSPFYSFKEGGFVRRFYHESNGSNPDDNRISVWRALPVKFNESEADCLIHQVAQCHDKDGPKMAPDVISGVDIGKWPQEYLAHEYNKRLASSNSARSGSCHYAPACIH
jgi:hypothetical protein